MSDNIFTPIEHWLNEVMPWMYWKVEVILFLVGFFSFLVVLAVVSTKKQSNPKIGFLKIPTTTGDKVFISAVLFVAIMLIILAIGLPWYLTLIIGAPIITIIFLRG